MDKFGLKYFKTFQEYILSNYGISYSQQKTDLLQSKINKIMRKHKLSSYEQLYKELLLQNDFLLLNEFQDEITIHKTDFFRENIHFEFLSGNLSLIVEKNPRIMASREIRVWSSACSSGEEPYTIAMVLKEILPQPFEMRVLGTDISSKVLRTAQRGVYSLKDVAGIPHNYLKKYFVKAGDDYQVIDEIKELVTFRQFNLINPFPFKKGLDIIFCRNVLIYFSPDIQAELIDKFSHALVDGGLLFLGLSEAMVQKTRFKHLGPSIYIKA